MRTKIYKIFFSAILLTLFSFFIVGCVEENNTGYSTLKPTSPTISITPGFTSPVALVENDSKYEYTVTLSEPQLVDVHLNIAQIGGNATESDFEMTTIIAIPAGATSGKGYIKILSDDVIEGTETLKIQIGDQSTANASLTPITVEFSIQNLTENDLVIGLSWNPSTPTTDDEGTEIDADALADMRLLITDSPYSEVIEETDGATFESFTMLGSMADGEYLVVADFFETLPSPVRDLDLSVSFEQLGVIDPFSFDFPAAINTGTVCPVNYFILAKVVKAGNQYTIEKIGETQPLTVWYGIDTESEYPSEVTTKFDCDGNVLITGLVFGWMADFWGEEIISQEDVIIDIDSLAGKVTINKQPYITTLYDGKEFPYSISGSGTFDASGEYPVMTINYVLDQDGSNPAQWCVENGYMVNAFFTAKLTLDPAGLKSASVANLKPTVKPVR
jgi:hypothetical protein